MELKFGDVESIAFRDRMAPREGSGVPAANRTTSPWRLHARKVITAAFVEYPGLDRKSMKRLLSTMYPFGQRKYTPYKIWCAEVNAALGGPERKAK